PYLYSGSQMKAECGIDYHDLPIGHALANGVTITDSRYPMGLIRYGVATMESENPGDWMDQCTYAHLVKSLQDPPDPPVLAVRGVLSRDADSVAGELLPAYPMDGEVDLTGGDGGDYAIVTRGADGSVLARYPFEPDWTVPDLDGDRDLLSFLYRIPASD